MTETEETGSKNNKLMDRTSMYSSHPRKDVISDYCK